MKDNSHSSEDILSQLDQELNESWDELKQLHAKVKQGIIGLEQYHKSKSEIETRIDELSGRIQYIQKAMKKIPTTEERILREAELLMNEYQVELIDDSIFHMRLYLTVSVHQTWILEVNFSDPKVPLFKFPLNLVLMIGDPYETILSLKTWTGKHDEYIINVIREVEQKLLDLELTKSMPELELERGRIMSQAKTLEEGKEFSRAMVFYNYAADLSERIGNDAIAIMCRLKAKKMLGKIEKKKS